MWGCPRTTPHPTLSTPVSPHPRSRDFYHTCYCLSGLAIAQHFGSGDLHHELVLGGPENRLVGPGERAGQGWRRAREKGQRGPEKEARKGGKGPEKGQKNAKRSRKRAKKGQKKVREKG